MSVIQRIRDKGALISAIVIAISLLGFILMDAFAGKGSIFNSGASTVIGKVNGKSIKINDFRKKVEAMEEQYRQSNSPYGKPTTEQIVQQVWNSEISEALVSSELDKLGMNVGEKELNNVLYVDPPAQLRQQLTDPQTGQYNVVALQQAIQQTKKSKNPEELARMNQFLAGIEFDRAVTKYSSLLGNTFHFPKWYIEKQNADNSLMGKASYVQVPYTVIPDSSVVISDKEIQDYIDTHKEDYKQQESRSIAYVLFSALPSASDSTSLRDKLVGLKDEFAQTTDYENFLRKEDSQIPFADIFVNEKDIKIPNKDSILSQPIGTVYGPYLDGGNYNLSKVIAQRTQPDTVKVRHILIATVQQDPQSGQSFPIRADSTAKNLADSIKNAIAGGANFDTLLLKYTDDPGSKNEGGVYDHVYSGQMVPEFNNFIFGNPTGSKGVVKTSFGYHYIEILSQKGSSRAYKVAYLSKPIVASEETDNAANNAASSFAGNSRSLQSFDENFEKDLRPKGYNKFPAMNIGPNAYSIPGVGNSRQFIKAIYDADKGDVLQPYRVEDNYVVAVVTDVFKEGIESVVQARPTIEPLLRNKKKAEEIKKKIGTVSTLEAVATAMGQQVTTADSIRFNGSTALGYEPKVLGAIFNPANAGKVVPEPVGGQGGVYVLKVDEVGATALETADIELQRAQLEARARQMNGFGGGQFGQQMQYNPANVLRESATIKDYRAKFY